MAIRPVDYKRLSGLFSLMLIGLLATGCELKLPAMPWDAKKPPAQEAAASEETAAETEGEGGESEETGADDSEAPPDPNAASQPSAMQQLPYEEVMIPMPDRLMLYGRLYDPAIKPEGEEDTEAEGSSEAAGSDEATEGEDAPYAGPRYPLVILLHGLNRNYAVWNDLPARLVKAGYAVLALDLRGHGKSTRIGKKGAMSWRFFSAEQWQLLPKDVGKVIAFFAKDKAHPEVDAQRVALIGEKLGANAAIHAAKSQPYVKAMVLFNPGLDYKGLVASYAVLDYLNPVLVLTGNGDEAARKAIERLVNAFPGAKEMQVYPHPADGADLLTAQPAVGDRLTAWLMAHLPSSQAAKP